MTAVNVIDQRLMQSLRDIPVRLSFYMQNSLCLKRNLTGFLSGYFMFLDVKVANEPLADTWESATSVRKCLFSRSQPISKG